MFLIIPGVHIAYYYYCLYIYLINTTRSANIGMNICISLVLRRTYFKAFLW